ncbi:MAG: hypothetical protein AB1673_10325 [Actinomycetota bacterium]
MHPEEPPPAAAAPAAQVAEPPGPVGTGATTWGAGDCTLADMAAGEVGGGAYLSSTAGQPELVLAPTVAAELTGAALANDWFTEPWKEGGTVEFGEGGATLDGATLGNWGLYGSERSLEFVATFAKRPHQHVGFGTDFRSVPWVTFSTKFGHGLYARSNFLIPEDVRLPTSLLGHPHRFRIDWNVLDVDFWVDDRLVAHQLVPMVGYMRPLAGNGSLGGTPLRVEWMRMSPYARLGTFTSRVLDAGRPVTWTSCEIEADLPSPTAVTAEVRAGESPAPDQASTWSAWAPVTGPSPEGRYAQYRLTLTTTNPSRTPVVRSVSLRYSSSSSSSSSSSGPRVGGGSSGT